MHGIQEVGRGTYREILSIPILGRFIGWVLSVLLEYLVWRIVSAIADGFLALLGIDLTKKLRVCIIVLSGARRAPTTSREVLQPLQPAIDSATRIYRSAANIKFIVGDIHWIEQPAPKANLDPACDGGEPKRICGYPARTELLDGRSGTRCVRSARADARTTGAH